MIIKEWNQTRFYSIQNEFALTKNKTAPAGIKEQKGGVNKEHLVDISGSNQKYSHIISTTDRIINANINKSKYLFTTDIGSVRVDDDDVDPVVVLAAL